MSWSAKIFTLSDDWSWCHFAKSSTWICSMKEYFTRERGPIMAHFWLQQKFFSGITNIQEHSYKNLQWEKEKHCWGRVFKIRNTEQKKKNWKMCNKTWHVLNWHNSSVYNNFLRKNTQHWENFGSPWKMLIVPCLLSSFLAILKWIGFTHKKIGGRKLLLEREDITACFRFLSQIRKENFDEIMWLDTTSVNASHTVVKRVDRRYERRDYCLLYTSRCV